MVRLLQALAELTARAVIGGFNPTMVRLLLRAKNLRLGGARWFQSHNGAIAAHASIPQTRVQYVFQSHNGAIAAVRKWEHTAKE